MAANKWGIQVMSDLHLEMYRSVELKIPVNAPYLALLGDISVMKGPAYEKYKMFLETQSKLFKHVFVLLGNHGKKRFNAINLQLLEYYTTSVEEALKLAKEACSAFPNVTLMQKTSVLIDGVRLLGTTLWSLVRMRLI
jgi:hypothetical protein